ncbi:MAG: hydroxymethylbilane synthase [Gemmatimonadetes bacterium]|nr:hydroxymethylbilane synthase [Gemmatimonadota bacterium]
MNPNRVLRIGARASALARRQADLAAEALRLAQPDAVCEVVAFSTRGDRDPDRPLPEIGGKGVFTAELEAALRNGAIAVAVHSLKDLPTEESPDLVVAAVLERADPCDVLVSRTRRRLADLPPRPGIGTSCLRREAQIAALRPDARLLPLRGNVETRVRKATEPDGPYDAIVLAAAGLARLGLEAVVAERFAPDRFFPAPGQGAIALQCRTDDPLRDALRTVNHAPTWAAVAAERAFLAALGCGCSAPVGALGRVEGDRLVVRGMVASADGRALLRVERTGSPAGAEALGRALAAAALEAGAADLLAARS